MKPVARARAADPELQAIVATARQRLIRAGYLRPASPRPSLWARVRELVRTKRLVTAVLVGVAVGAVVLVVWRIQATPRPESVAGRRPPTAETQGNSTPASTNH